jgi:hypothetical protein
MNKVLQFIGELFLINSFVVGLILVSSLTTDSYSAQLTKKELVRVNDEGAVTVRITYLNPIKNINKGELDFEVRMNTHSVNLDNYKMEELSFLKDDKGNTYKPLGWFNPGGGGHHRFGVIKFSSKDSKGKDIIDKNTKYIHIIIKGVDNVNERSFQWNFPLK